MDPMICHDQIALRTYLSVLRATPPGATWLQRHFGREHQHSAMPDGYGKSMVRAAKQIRADFYAICGDSEIQVSKLAVPLSLFLAQRPTLVLATFGNNGLAIMLLSQGLPPDTFLKACSPHVRKMVWIFCAIVSHAVRETDAYSKPLYPALKGVLEWLEMYVCEWKTSIASVMLVHELLHICARTRHNKSVVANHSQTFL